MEMILNFLPLTQQEQAAFLAAAPEASQVFLPVPALGSPVEAEAAQFSEAAVILGCPSVQQLSGCRKLKWLQTWSAGVDPYLAPGVLDKDTLLTSAVGAYGQSVSEHMLACMLALMKRLPAYRDRQRGRVWEDAGRAKSPALARVLILGTGDLGGHFAALCKALGAYTVGLNRHPDSPREHFDELDHISRLDKWLPWADVVASTLPETPETIRLFDAERLEAMRRDAILINAGRGSGVDCVALAAALRAGKLWGAALDVTEPEPLPAAHPLWACDNLLLTPHVAGSDHLPQTARNVAAIALENVRRYFAGEKLRNLMAHS